MNQDLLDVVKGSKIFDRFQAVSRYSQLLQIGGMEHANELVELADTLGKSVSDISADAKTLETYAALEARLQAGVDRDARTKFRDAKLAKQKFDAETARILEERQLQRKQLDRDEMETEGEFKSAAAAEETMHRMQRQFGELLGDRSIPHI